MSGYGVLASKLGVKVKVEGLNDTIYPPILPSPSPSLEAESSPKLQHIYYPLKRDEIRLLVLNPGAGDEPISCFLENYAVTKPKPFSALSYAWGADTPVTRRPILLDGCSVMVTENLHAFLARHRAELSCRVLWIDALCINQDDLAERRAQIHLMKRVYESAERVIIWLGESTPAIDAAVSRIRNIYRSWWCPILERTGSPHRSLATITDNDIADLLQGSSSGVQPQGQQDEQVGLKAGQWRAGIHEVLSRPWWYRIWVYQEATAPCGSGAQVLIGPHLISFDAVLTVNQIICSIAWRGHPDPLFSAKRGQATHPAAYMETYMALRKRYQATGSSRFLRLADLLSVLRKFDAMNPRDKLYALIPTSLDGAELLDVAYDRPVEDVYADAAWCLIRTHRNLDVLGHCSPSSPDDGAPLPNLPSWVPNWTAKSTAIHLFKRGLSARLPSAPKESDSYGVYVDDAGVEIEKLYSASGDSVAEASLDPTGSVLFCAGFAFDRIQDVSPSASTDLLGADVAQTWAEWLRVVPAARFPEIHQRLSQGALSRILVADCDRVALDVGMRRGGKSKEAPLSDREESDSQGNYFMDITGPHPAPFRRRLIVTEKGYLGLTAEHVRTGDVVVIMMGGQVPLVLRQVQQHYVLIGEAYIDGIMDGEALAKSNANGGNTIFTIR